MFRVHIFKTEQNKNFKHVIKIVIFYNTVLLYKYRWKSYKLYWSLVHPERDK